MHIVIIGGGLAGAACALHILRDHPHLPARITVVEPRDTLGAGLAYSTPAIEHRTNVAASRMSILADQPDSFHDWARAHNTPALDPESEMPDGRLYPARAVFGRYVASLLQAQIDATPGIGFTHCRASATDVTRTPQHWRIALDTGDTLIADAVVLAVSHARPDLPAPLRHRAGIIADPWDSAALGAIPPQHRVVIIGTGLTACDVIATLLRRGHTGPITALSRHGLLPRPRTTLPVQAEGDFTTAPARTASALLRTIRAAIATARSAGRPWENIIDALRQQSAAAWGTLDWDERRRLLRHVRSYWDVHRFQCAPQIDAALSAAQRTGALRIMAATLLRTAETANGLAITMRHRGSETSETLYADTAINCTGPGHRSVTATHPVLRGLAAAGLLRPDPAALGIWVDTQSRVLRADGCPNPTLFVAGPLARGTFGELMGIPQVTLQPREVASRLAALVETRGDGATA
jgi:uncharacterized NAD(P)/FAD-binding protein YdhS